MTDLSRSAPLAPKVAMSNDEARTLAMQSAFSHFQAQPTSLIDFRSAGRLLILGEGEEALRVMARLDSEAGEALSITLLLPQSDMHGEGDPRIARGILTELNGYLGHFEATVQRDGNASALAPLLAGTDYFDLVLDLNTSPVLPHPVPPLGYYASAGDEALLAQALEALPQLVGEFEKPKFFDYDPAICAHGRMGKEGCRRCIEACPTLAITSLGEQVSVNPNLCQGGGSCVAVCPSGAMRYAYPAVNDLLAATRDAMGIYRNNGGNEPRLLFYGGERFSDGVRAVAEELPGNIFAIEVEEIGSLGLDAWLTMLAFGAAQVLLYLHPEEPEPVRRALHEQLGFTHALLAGVGQRVDRVQIVEESDSLRWLTALRRQSPMPAIPPADYRLANHMRHRVRDALEYLDSLIEQPESITPLPPGAPFGEVLVASERCTLCHACVAICPLKALAADADRPQLLFIEAECVQCGLCEGACPEAAIQLTPRYLHAHEDAVTPRLLHEEEPFNCVRCGKPFATAKLMATMSQRLADHWMFQDEAAKRRLQMCDECRVIDMFENGDGFPPHRRSE